MKRILICSIAFTISLYLFRVAYTGSLLFLFIPWNLFLAWLPLLFSSQLKNADFNLKNGMLFCLWLLFFPNSPYLITDLFHLQQREGVPLYFDLVLLFTAAWNGLLMGLLSLKNIENKLKLRFSINHVQIISIGCFLLCGFGIYLGRFERYNSWHLLTQPIILITDIASKIIQPWQHPRAWAVTVLFALLLLLIYETLKKMPALFGEQAIDIKYKKF